jgi:E3 ubiquitin-protein ligase RNF14
MNFVFSQSIYPDYISSPLVDGVIKLEIPVELPESTRVIVTEDILEEPTQTKNLDELETTKHEASLSSLPPVLLEILLPSLYPHHLPPVILSAHATHAWFSITTTRLHQELLKLWQEGEGVLFNWIDWIRGGEFLNAVGLSKVIEGERRIQ